MPNNWTDIHADFNYQGYDWETNYQEQWENNGFNYEQTQDWINIGLAPTDADFCAWLVEEGYTALAVLNYEDSAQLKTEYQQTLTKKPLFDWYSENQITFAQFSYLSQQLGTKVANDYPLTQLNNLLATTTPTKPNYPLTKIILILALTGTIIYLFIN